jgi:hypothetical protein
MGEKMSDSSSKDGASVNFESGAQHAQVFFMVVRGLFSLGQEITAQPLLPIVANDIVS